MKNFAEVKNLLPTTNKSLLLCAALLSVSTLMFSQEPKPAHPHTEPTLSLREGWNLQSSGKVDEKGRGSFQPDFKPKEWYTVTVPTTVVAAIVEDKGLSRSWLRDEFAVVARSYLSHRLEFFQHPNATGQPFHHSVVVPKGVCSTRKLQGKKHLAEFWRDQLSSQRLAER